VLNQTLLIVAPRESGEILYLGNPPEVVVDPLSLGDNPTYLQAQTFADTRSIGGYSDWVIPTAEEMLVVRKNSLRLLSAFSQAGAVQQWDTSYYWTSSPGVFANTQKAQSSSGIEQSWPLSEPTPVRLIRRQQA
jgi:hypothetical protein